MIRQLLGFAPWIAYAIVATGDTWRYGALTGLAIALAIVLFERKSAGKPLDELVIPVSGVVFFALLGALSLVWPAAPFMRYGPALVDAWLAATTLGSILIGRPFTSAIARTMAPREVWDLPEFHRVNVVITWAWTASFALSAVTLTLVLTVAPGATLAVIAIKAAGIAAPSFFSARYPQIVEARYA